MRHRSRSRIDLQISHQQIPGRMVPLAERRRNLRIAKAYPALVRGVDGSGQLFEDRTNLADISERGLYLRLWRCVEPGTRLLVVVRVTHGNRITARIALSGLVRRVDAQSDFCWGIAIGIRHHRFLSPEGDRELLSAASILEEPDRTALNFRYPWLGRDSEPVSLLP